MGVAHRSPPARSASMRPPQRPASAMPRIGGAPSPAAFNSSVLSSCGTKRKERDFDQDDFEKTNIQVVVRCRGRSDREVMENSGVVVETNGVAGKTVELSMGPNAISNKTYHFDKVFSPAADQAILFEDVVAPILDDMLSGYNCTIFAYGQTGTGKTYTMSGDMTDTLGLLSDAAGIIPRTLYSLFRRLEAEEVEYSVKCSFIELYNEQLADLLSSDDSVKLKIFDDTNHKSHNSTVVQGVEEVYIKNASSGVKLLQRGSHRRQVAATKYNDLSSRSHTIFTIMTYIKKSNESGEDYICSGKLNLVDLAGSENIQRSGAENKRATEAGLINKSLLTLGRVINALVEKGSHIPYRESKLTRLLQDSLGGRTNTCIIATISSAKSNLEETISTLDYAFRAKNIRNRPQVNSTVSKKTLLKEFTAEIEKLKSELIATRQRNGVYLTNEQYEDITAESESRRILSEEQKVRVETMETSLRNKVRELFNLTNNFTVMKRESEATRAVLLTTETVLGDTKERLEDETVLRKAHQEMEDRLKHTGTQLISTVGSSVKDLDGVHSKLRRISELHAHNRHIWQMSAGRVKEMTGDFGKRLEAYHLEHNHLLSRTTGRVQCFVSEERMKLANYKQMLANKIAGLEKFQIPIKQHTNSAQDNMNNVLEEIKALGEDIKENVETCLKDLSRAATKTSDDVIEELEQFQTQCSASYSSLGKDFNTLFEDMTEHLAAQREENSRLRVALQEANLKNIEASRAATSQLQSLLQEERRLSQQERQQLKDQIFALVDAAASARDVRIGSGIAQTQIQLNESVEAFQRADKVFGEGMDMWTAQDWTLMHKMTGANDEIQAKMKMNWTVGHTGPMSALSANIFQEASARNTAIQLSMKAAPGETDKIVDAQLIEMVTQMSTLDDYMTRAQDHNGKSHQQHINDLLQFQLEIAGLGTGLRQTTEDQEIDLLSLENDSKSAARELTHSTSSFRTAAEENIANIQEQVDRTSLKDYVPTGETPQKKEWSYPTDLPSIANHLAIIAGRRGFSSPGAESLGARAPGRSPRKRGSPRKSPSKPRTPMKPKVYTDPAAVGTLQQANMTEQLRSFKEVDMNVISAANSLSDKSHTLDFSKSIGTGQLPPLKRHATAAAVMMNRISAKTPSSRTAPAGGSGVENMNPTIGLGRTLRNNPPP